MQGVNARMCKVCGSHALVPARTPYASDDLLRCQICSHVMVSPASSKFAENRDRQRSVFGEAFTMNASPMAGLYHRINSHRTERLLNLHARSAILEIGPGLGDVMAHLSARGHDVVGLDLSVAIRDAIHRKYGLQVLVEDISGLSQRAPARWDVVVMRHVLEHFESPVSALQSAAQLLRPGGKLYVAVPNMDSWHRRWRGWSGYEPYHLHFFGATSLTRALHRARLDIVRIGTYESLSGWTNTLWRSFGTETPLGGEAAVIHPRSSQRVGRMVLECCRLAMGLASTPLRIIQGAIGRGEELYAVAAKMAK